MTHDRASAGRAPRLRHAGIGILVAAVISAVLLSCKDSQEGPGAQLRRIGVVQVSDHPLLNITRDSFVAEMEQLGYRPEDGVQIFLENASGDLPTVSSIVDRFLQDEVDIVVPISTACTQVALHRVKDRPVVFATVANPFIIGAGVSDSDHLPNVTGVHGAAPMDQTLALVRRFLPGPITVGCIWDPAHANSVFNVENLERAVEADSEASFQGVTISSSAEVYQAALSLVHRNIDIFVLSPDNIVYSAFESVVKAARVRHVPIVISDVERLKDGAVAALGYDYTQSGRQAARLVDRILSGEDPGGIPFERYEKVTVGVNLDAAKAAGLSIPADLLASVDMVLGAPPSLSSSEKR